MKRLAVLSLLCLGWGAFIIASSEIANATALFVGPKLRFSDTTDASGHAEIVVTLSVDRRVQFYLNAIADTNGRVYLPLEELFGLLHFKISRDRNWVRGTVFGKDFRIDGAHATAYMPKET